MLATFGISGAHDVGSMTLRGAYLPPVEGEECTADNRLRDWD